jgi:hypothetical protein
MEPIEARRFELAQPIGNDAGPPTKAGRDSRAGVNREAVRQQLPTAKCTGVRDDLVEVQPYGCIVGGDDGPGADANDGVQWHAVPHELPRTPTCGAAQPAGAQNDA